MSLVSVLMPAYNEGKTLENAVKITMKELRGLDYEIVIINDGSTDNTEEVARMLCESYKNIKLASYPENRGKGYALKKGFEKSVGDIIVFFDSDLEIPPFQIRRFLKALNNGYDVVIGSKYLPGARVDYSMKRRLFSIWYRSLVKVLLKLDVSDTQVGLKVFRREVLENAFSKILVKKYAFDVELLTVINMYGYRIHEIPIKIEHNVFNSSMTYREIVRMFIDTLAIFYRKNLLHYYDGEDR
ncbi:glycosyltransferase family 2 protein [Thermococcus sp. MV11]|uniref:glycosyltransferase family 2 protein n=1 Tax=Thermococcus sp. MV11 TaxID=1638267 RepID=UPI001431688F|nr:glycosyltransferase family 2 protein [Thermococcus sp. MV11]NJE03856.1 glycosyltransferase family 2 protein [Thermococcus sp. MV11]